MFYGPRGISVGSQNDIEKITKMLNLMVSRLSMYSRSKLDYTQLQKDLGGEHTLRLLPPLVATRAELARGVAMLEAAIVAAAQG